LKTYGGIHKQIVANLGGEKEYSHRIKSLTGSGLSRKESINNQAKASKDPAPKKEAAQKKVAAKPKGINKMF